MAHPAAQGGAPTTLTLRQRHLLVTLLDEAADRINEEARALDPALAVRFPQHEPVDGREFDRATQGVEAAYSAAAELEDLASLISDATFITAQSVWPIDPAATLAQALIASWAAGHDVGETVVVATAAAQSTVFGATEEWLTSNRPGSWEASVLHAIIEKSGWDTHNR